MRSRRGREEGVLYGVLRLVLYVGMWRRACAGLLCCVLCPSPDRCILFSDWTASIPSHPSSIPSSGHKFSFVSGGKFYLHAEQRGHSIQCLWLGRKQSNVMSPVSSWGTLHSLPVLVTTQEDLTQWDTETFVVCSHRCIVTQDLQFLKPQILFFLCF